MGKLGIYSVRIRKQEEYMVQTKEWLAVWAQLGSGLAA